MTFLKRLALVFCTAYILMFFSEFFFVNEGHPTDIVEMLQTNWAAMLLWPIEFTLWYGGPAYIFLAAIGLFRARTVWALVLAGALYGWAVEGIVVWQMYEFLPYSISWTPLGWHVLVDVLLGWYLVRRVLLKDDYRLTAVLAIALGLFWGLWGTWFWVETELVLPQTFAVFALFTGSLWAAANAVIGRFAEESFRPSKFEVGLLILWAVGLFAIQIVPMLPMAVLILPPLMAVTLAALWRNKQAEDRASIITIYQGRVRLGHYALLLLTPILAAVTYPIYYTFGIYLPVADLLAPLLMIVGFIVYLVGMWKTAVH